MKAGLLLGTVLLFGLKLDIDIIVKYRLQAAFFHIFVHSGKRAAVADLELLVADFVGGGISSYAEHNVFSFTDLAGTIRIRLIFDTISYIVRPVIIMIELFIIIPDKKYRSLCILPSAINAIIFSTAFFDSSIAFTIDINNKWASGPLHISIYISQLIYVVLLLVFSIIYFQKKNVKRTIIVLAIFLQSVIVGALEYTNLLPGYANPITALCMLEYYIYLSVIYQQEMRDTIAQKELDIAKSNLLVLRNQIQPHFIYNTLSIIRSLARRDGKMAVSCIDTFSKYLKSHIGAIQKDDLIPFMQELENVKVYLSLVQIDYTNKVEIVYDLGYTDFLIPPLSLEPIVENAVDHGISRGGGKLTIHTHEDKENENIIVSIADNGTARNDKDKEDYVPIHNGIGLDNTRKRLAMQCSSTLELNITDSGAEAVITLPKREVSEKI